MTHARRLTDNVNLPATSGRIIVVLLTALSIGAGVLSWSRWVSDPRRWLFSYLTALAFLVTISIGALAWLMLQHLTRTVWSVVIRRLLENLTRPLPLLAVGFVPLALNLSRVYSWADPSRVAADPALAQGRLAESIVLQCAGRDLPGDLGSDRWPAGTNLGPPGSDVRPVRE